MTLKKRSPSKRRGMTNRFYIQTNKSPVPLFVESLVEYWCALLLNCSKNIKQIIAHQNFTGNYLEKKLSRYPDLTVTFDDDKILVIEVKRLASLEDPDTVASLHQTKHIVNNAGFEFRVLTENDVKLSTDFIANCMTMNQFRINTSSLIPELLATLPVGEVRLEDWIATVGRTFALEQLAQQIVYFDMTQRLSGETLIRTAKENDYVFITY